MAVLVYLSIVNVPGSASKALAFSRVVNPSAIHQEEKIKDHMYFTQSTSGKTRIKLEELCRIIESLNLVKKSQIVVYPDDRVIARLGEQFGIEEGEQAPAKNRDLWTRLANEVKKNQYDISFIYQGLMSDSIHDNLLCECEKVAFNG